MKVKQNELKWIEFARRQIGIQEKLGKENNPDVIKMFDVAFKAVNQADKLKQAVWQQDSTPWCGIFVAYVLASVGLVRHIPEFFPMARSYERVGTKLAKPAYGCVVTFTRQGGGHVGFVVGKDKRGNLMVLGGNQGDAVNIKPFALSRVTSYRWCGTQPYPAPHRYDLPVLESDGRVSRNER